MLRMGTAEKAVRTVLAIATGIVTVLAFGYYLGKFVEDVYPIVPQQFGGGHPVFASITLSKTEVTALRSLDRTIQARASYWRVEVLFEGEDYYLLGLPEAGTPPGVTVIRIPPVFRVPKENVILIEIRGKPPRD